MGSASLKITEPSMEDILASIRRIISDDQEAPLPPEPDEPASSSLKNVLDIAELHVAPLIGSRPNEPVLGPWNRGDHEEIALEDALVQPGPYEPFHEADGPEELVPAPGSLSEPTLRRSEPRASPEPASARTLLSQEAKASVSTSFDRLSASVRPSQPKTVEDLMKEMLRPMLKAWLDDHLPPLVEGLVREEIERIARRRA
jgi:cell pole-organizing protein PopZ